MAKIKAFEICTSLGEDIIAEVVKKKINLFGCDGKALW